jgi:hypothetical protein
LSPRFDKNKLKNFPSVYAISTIEAFDRRSNLVRIFKEYDIDVNINVYSRNIENEVVVGEAGKEKNLATAVVMSHLKSIKKWYTETSEEYAIFVEDDISLETVPYWNFTWEEFFTELPSDWECVQLSWVRQYLTAFGDKIRNRCWCDWGAVAYLMSRKFAKKLIDAYYPNNEFHLAIQGSDVYLRPEWCKYSSAENLIFSALGRVYSFMMFVEDFPRFYTEDPITFMYGGIQSTQHGPARESVLNWWKTIGRYRSLSESKEWA